MLGLDGTILSVRTIRLMASLAWAGHFAANILRFNRTENVANTRYSLAIGGIAALQSIKFV
jgi:hypothetical protein